MFGKKKLTLDDILKGIEELSPEEQEQVKGKMDDLYKSENENEEENTDVEEVKAEVSEESSEEVEESGESGEKVSEENSETNENAVEEAEKKVEDHEEGDAQKWANVEARLTALEEAMKGYSREPRETDKSESDKLNYLAKKFE